MGSEIATIVGAVIVLGALAMNFIVWSGLGGRVNRLEKETVKKPECHALHKGLEKGIELMRGQLSRLEDKIDSLLRHNGIKKR